MEKRNFQDNSEDKKYFTIIPNYIANHSTANDQSLYFQMKRLVGDKEGVCYASEKYFKDKMGVGSKALKKSFQYLLDHGWIEDAGVREVETRGGAQKVRTYLVKDIWKLNMDYYSKGVSEREPLENKGVSESNQRGVQKETKGVAFEQQRRTMKNNSEEDISKEIQEPVPSYGNENINQITDFLKGKLGGSPDGSVRENRRFAKLLLDKLFKDYPDQDNARQVEFLIEAAVRDSFHAKNATSFKYLYYHAQQIIQSVKKQKPNALIL